MALVACLVLSVPSTPALAQDAADEGWHNDAEFSFVGTSGNSESSSLGFSDRLWRRWTKSAFELNAGGIRVQTKKVTEFAVGPAGTFRVREVSETETNAENYFLNGSYLREINKALYWRAGAGWVRNVPSGISNRYAVFGTVGNIWKDEEHLKFRTEYGLTVTNEENVVEDPTTDDTYGGLGLMLEYDQAFGKSKKTRIGDSLVINENLNDTADLRVDNTFWVSVAMTDLLSLKVSYQILYDNQPALQTIDRFDTDPGDPAAATPDGQVNVPVEKTDTIFRATLVVSF